MKPFFSANSTTSSVGSSWCTRVLSMCICGMFNKKFNNSSRRFFYPAGNKFPGQRLSPPSSLSINLFFFPHSHHAIFAAERPGNSYSQYPSFEHPLYAASFSLFSKSQWSSPLCLFSNKGLYKPHAFLLRQLFFLTAMSLADIIWDSKKIGSYG